MRRRTIVGFGEAFLVEYPDRALVAGLAAEVAARATRLGHRGVIVTRLGQDDGAREVLEMLGTAGIDTSHVQTDPDLPTPRVVVRGQRSGLQGIPRRAAFDNIQWDFDLEDVAQVADAVVFGLFSRRGGQTRSEQNRFLEACSRAVKVLDLTNRTADFDRGDALVALALSNAAIIDETSLQAIAPRWRSQPLDDAIHSFARDAALSFVIALGGSGVLALHARGASGAVPFGEGSRDRLGAALAAIHAILDGQELGSAVEIAERLGASGTASPIA